MATPILATKLYIPPPRLKAVVRSRLIERLNAGLCQAQGFGRKLTLISAPAGFGKTTLVSSWVNALPMALKAQPKIENRVAWLSLDEDDNDPTRFLSYFVAALQTVQATLGEGIAGILQSPQPPVIESILTTLLNEIAAVPHELILVLDDYHLIDAQPIDKAIAFLLDHLPPRLHLVIVTREDPPLPLARLRVRGQLVELRANDLRFTAVEAAAFFNQGMGLALSAENIAALETRTEGWIAGLQLAALALQGTMQDEQDISSFIQSFTGSHRFVLDYLVEEVLQQQPESVQTFLLHTSVLERLCGSLCEAVMGEPFAGGQETLAYLEQANLFIIPLDSERRWYRYHHLFAELLRQRLHQNPLSLLVGVLHRRASVWYEANGLDIEAFHHAVAANDVARAARLVEGKGMPLLFRGAVAPVLNWLASLPKAELDARPALWVLYASALVFVGQMDGVEEKLQAAEVVLQAAVQNDENRDHIGHIAAIRATLAIPKQQVDMIITQSQRALAYLHPHNLPVRTATSWTLGFAYQIQGDRVAASRAYAEASANSAAIGHIVINIAATTGLGHIQKLETQLYEAAESYRRVVQVAGDPPWPVACEAYLGLGRLSYEWNDLDVAGQYAQKGIELGRQLESIDTVAMCEVLLARLALARGDGAGALVLLAGAERFVRERHFLHRLPQITAVYVLALLRQGDLAAADKLAGLYDLPISRARVCLARGDGAGALAALAPMQQQAEARGWADERLQVMVLQAVVFWQQGKGKTAVSLLNDALARAEPSGFVRLFVDEGLPMVEMLSETAVRGARPAYVEKLLAAFGNMVEAEVKPQPVSLVEPLSQRELEVLQLIAQGLSNREISQRLFLALSTVKGHNRIIFDKLQVQRRTEAVARARALGLL